MSSKLKPLIFSGNANKPLAEKICNVLSVPMGEINVGRFSDGEINVKTEDHVRGEHVYICQSIGPSNGLLTDSALMEVLLMSDAMRRAGAERITVVAPYLGYSRQDKKDSWGVPIGAKVIAQILQAVGINDLITLDIHAKQIQGFFDSTQTAPYDFNAIPIIRDDIKNRFGNKKIIIVTPDVGGIKRADLLAKYLDAPLAIVRKYRPEPGVSKVIEIIGDVNGYTAILIDDMADTSGTICNAAVAVKAAGAIEVYGYATHGLYSQDALHTIEKTPELLNVTSTDSLKRNIASKKIFTLSVAPMLAGIIDTHFNNKSFRELDVLQ